MSDLSQWFLAHYEVLHDFAGPFATVIAAVAAVCVTWSLGTRQTAIAKQQAVIADDRLRYDLFELRLDVFNAARGFIADLLVTGKVSDGAPMKFLRDTDRAVFLFDASVTEYIMELYREANNLKAASNRVNDTALSAAERNRLIDIEVEKKTWFAQQQHVLIEKFRPALGFERNVAPHASRPV